ncbi:MAG: hypothetical protein HC883_05935 [Bdellovibrionaceae bacterium]|nr:hypothetical protein [Pseudobdellovibrionaceae bacterium]
MQEVKTALGRWIPSHEVQTVLEDNILRVLFDYRMNPQNPNNVPMKISEIARAVSTEEKLVVAALEALKMDQNVEEKEEFQQERTFGISGYGIRFVRNIPDAS